MVSAHYPASDAGFLVPLDLDDLLARLFVDRRQPQRRLRHGLHPWYQSSFTLTALDPWRLAPALETPSESVCSVRAVCETFGLPASAADAVVRGGATSVTLLALLTEDKVEQVASGEGEDTKARLRKMVAALRQGQHPLEPLHSLKRLFHRKSSDKVKDPKVAFDKSLAYLDLAQKVVEVAVEAVTTDTYLQDRVFVSLLSILDQQD